MDSKIAREILVKLVEGIDPDTGKGLGSDSVLQRANILRALLAGVSALEATGARAARRAQLPTKLGRRWDAVEQAALVSRFNSGMSLEEIARAHERTVRAIQLRLERLGVLSAGSSPWSPTTSQPATDKAGASNSDAE